MRDAFQTALHATFAIEKSRSLQAVKLSYVVQGRRQDKLANSLSVSTCIEGIQETSSRAEKLLAYNAHRKERLLNLEERSKAWLTRLKKYSDLHKQYTPRVKSLR